MIRTEAIPHIACDRDKPYEYRRVRRFIGYLSLFLIGLIGWVCGHVAAKADRTFIAREITQLEELWNRDTATKKL